MSDKGIPYVDLSWNPVTGCSMGCTWCWARRMATRLRGRCGYPADDPFRPTFHPGRLSEPLKWKKPRRVAVGFMGDWCDPGVTDSWRDQILGAMALAGNHTFLTLTKRPDLLVEYLTRTESDRGAIWNVTQSHAEEAAWTQIGDPKCLGLHWTKTWPLPNVWIGASITNQADADERLPYLGQLAAAGWHTWVSIEPLIDEVRLFYPPPEDIHGKPTCLPVTGPGMFLQHLGRNSAYLGRAVEWVVVGGASGPAAPPCNVEWVRSIARQCAVAGVPLYVKQLGAKAFSPSDAMGDNPGWYGFIERAGADPAEWPEDLRVQEIP